MEVVEFATSKYGKPSAIHRSYRFRCRHTGPNGNKYWVCIRYDIKCKSTLTNNEAGVFMKWNGEHDPPDVAQCEVMKAISTIRKCAPDEALIPVE